VVEFRRAAKKNRTRPRPEKKTGTFEMTFTGNLIDDLMATVERAERRAQSDEALSFEPLVAEPLLVEPWFASVQENADYDSELLGVA
jgi:hypothetical protein